MMEVKMVSIPVKDPIAAFKHYTTVLGFQKLMFDADAQLAIIIGENKSNTSILLEPIDGNDISKNYQAALRQANIPVMTFSTENLKEEYIRLVNLNVQFTKAPTATDWGAEAIFDDSCGNLIQLIEEG